MKDLDLKGLRLANVLPPDPNIMGPPPPTHEERLEKFVNNTEKPKKKAPKKTTKKKKKRPSTKGIPQDNSKKYWDTGIERLFLHNRIPDYTIEKMTGFSRPKIKQIRRDPMSMKISTLIDLSFHLGVDMYYLLDVITGVETIEPFDDHSEDFSASDAHE